MKEYQIFKTKDAVPGPGSRHAVEVVAGRNPSLGVQHYRIPNVSGVHEIGINLGEGARLEMVIEQATSAEVESLSRVRVKAGSDSALKLTVILDGGAKSAFEIDTSVEGRGARIELRGLLNAKARQQFSIRADAVHSVSDTYSDLQVWCAARDESRTVFNGRIHILQSAPRTEAFQKNRNLMLSKHATVDSFPKLLIENDEVKCAHGSSTSSLEPEQTYYLQARGIDPETAEAMMLKGFLRQPLEWISDVSIRHEIESRLGVLEEEWS
jgi:Fe-S cluster assembly protein SufD